MKLISLHYKIGKDLAKTNDPRFQEFLNLCDQVDPENYPEQWFVVSIR